MNGKISKINTELNKTKRRISELQERVQELEQQKTELENTDIVGLVRGAGMTSQELSTLLQAFHEHGGGPLSLSKQEDIENEK